MANYDDYRRDEERFAQELDDLAKIRESMEWERRLKQLVDRLGKTRKTVLAYRARLIRNAMQLRPDLSEAQASAWVDSIIGLEPAN
jgi:hypothetical protein